jgi:Protein of unknown function (DUF2934)
MSIQTATVKSKYVPVPIPINSENDNLEESLRSQIERRAFELFEQNGRNEGEAVSHWLQAESEILSRVMEVEESSSWFTVNVPLRGRSAADMQVHVEPTHALIAGTMHPASLDGSASGLDSPARTTFLLVKWPAAIDPKTASAYFQNDALNLTGKRDPAAALTDGLGNNKR